MGPADRSPVPITVSATFEPLGAGILGSAGPGLIWRNFPGAAQPNTWYADALANKLSGGQLDPAPDILASFNSVPVHRNETRLCA